MESLKTLFLLYFICCSKSEQAQAVEVIIEEISGTLSTDSWKLPQQTQHLEIRVNQIDDIKPEAICTASALQTIRVDLTKTKKPPILRQDMFKNCDNLTEMTINGSWKNKTELSASVLQHFTNLQHFVATSFLIPRLTRHFFTEMNNVSSLSLINCGIQEIDLGAFKNLKNLEILSLQSNEITVLSMNCFRNLAQLNRLDLSHNKISQLDWDEFDGSLSSLKSLNLGYNPIVALDAGKFAEHLPNLTNVVINHIVMECSRREEFAQELQEKLDRTFYVAYFDLIYYDYGASCETEERHFASLNKTKSRT